jgi:hypothetical protein
MIRTGRKPDRTTKQETAIAGVLEALRWRHLLSFAGTSRLKNSNQCSTDEDVMSQGDDFYRQK